MLTVTTTATEAIEELLSASQAPEEAGLRIAATAADEETGTTAFQLEVAEAEPGDQVLADGDLILEQVTSQLLSESELDAEIDAEGQVSFKLGPQPGAEAGEPEMDGDGPR